MVRWTLRVVGVLSTLAVLLMAPGGAVGAQASSPGFDGTPGSPADKVFQNLVQMQSVVQGLASDGTLGQGLAVLGLAPGSADGLNLGDLWDKTVNDRLQNHVTITDCASFANLATSAAQSTTLGRTYDITLPSGVSCSGGITIPLQLHVRREISAGLAVNTTNNSAPFSATSGIDVVLDVNLNLTFVYDATQDFFYVQGSGGGAPSLTAHIHASIPNATNVHAAFGILRVQLDPSTTFTADAYLKATVSDPSGTGKLGFAVPNGSGGTTPGVLASSTAASSIFAVGWDPGQTSSISGNLAITVSPDPSIGLNFGSVSGSIAISDPDLSNGQAPTITPSGFDASSVLGKFQNLSPRDLADGLAHLAQSLLAMQSAKTPAGGNIDLPFMKGKVGDAVQTAESLFTFISRHVGQQGAVPANDVGKPDFASIQDLLDELKTEGTLPGGATFTISAPAYDDSTSKFSVNISIDRAAGTPGNLDPGATNAYTPVNVTTTSVTYTATGLHDANAQNWTANQWAGYTVVAGGSKAEVNSNTANDLVVGSWAPSKPADGTTYHIQTQDPQTGLFQLGSTLNSVTGLSGANAVNATATVAPSYHVGLTLVLDVEPPKTGTGCAGTYLGQTVTACPFNYTAPDGSVRVIQSLPTIPDRFMLRTGGSLFWLDAPITTNISASASAGFVNVTLGGQLCEFTAGAGADCTHTNTDGNHLLNVSLVARGDAQNDIPLSQVFTYITGNSLNPPDPASLLTIGFHGAASACVYASVTGVTDFFSGGSPICGSPPSGSVAALVTVHDFNGSMSDISTTDPNANVYVQAPDFSKLLSLNNVDPKQLFLMLLQAIEKLSTQLQNVPGASDVLSTRIPLLNQTVGGLIGGNDTFDGKDVTFSTVAAVPADNTTTPPTPAVPAMTKLVDPHHTFDATWIGRTIQVGTAVGAVHDVDSADSTNHTIDIVGFNGLPATGSAYQASSELDAVINLLQQSPANTMQEMVQVLNSHFHKLGTAAQAVTFNVVDTGTTNPKLDIKIKWSRSFEKSVPIGFDVNIGGSQSLAGIGSQGNIDVGATIGLDADLLVALTTGSGHCSVADDGFCLGAGSNISASITAGSDNAIIKANLGPLAIGLGGDPTASTGGGKFHAVVAAGVGTTATAPGGESGVSVSDFFSNLHATLDPSGTTPVTCDGVDNGGTDLGVCANFPLYISKDGGHTYTQLTDSSSNPDVIKIRLPLADNVSDAFDFTANGNQVTSTNTLKRFDYPDNLPSDLAAAVLDLGDLNNGIDGYLSFARNALSLASDGGKLPLVGKDLQQGADFIGDLQSKIDGTLGSLSTLSTVGDLQNKIDGDLNTALNSATTGIPLVAKVTVRAECASSGQIKSPAATASATDTGSGSTKYKYEVIGVVKSGSESIVLAPGTESSEITNEATLDGTNFNHVGWGTADAQIDHYVVVRTEGPGAPVIVADNQTGSAGYDDKGSTVSGSVPTADPAPPCDASTNLSSGDLTGVLVTLDAGTGKISDNGCADDTTLGNCISAFSVPINIGVPGLALSSTGNSSDNLTLKLGYHLHLQFGMDLSHGFFLKGPTDESDPNATLIGVGASLHLPEGVKLNLAFLNVCVAQHGAYTNDVCNPTYSSSDGVDLADVTFAIKLKTSTGLVTFNDISSQGVSTFFDPYISGGLNIDWDFRVQIGSGSMLPGIGGEFIFKWKWSNQSTSTDMSSQGEDSDHVLKFTGIFIDVGDFLQGVIGQVMQQIQRVTAPLKPIVDVITAPIPLLSDLSHLAGGPDITLVTIAKAFSTLADGPDLSFIDTIVKVIKVISSLPSGNGKVNIGGFDLMGVAGGGVFKNAVNPTTADPTSNDSTLIGTSNTDSTSPLDQMESDISSGSKLSDTQNTTGGHHYGLDFPVLEHPSIIFNLLMGKDVPLITFDSGPLSLAFSYSQQFGPVYAPPPVMVVIAGNASITARIKLGFDTYGLRLAFQGNPSFGGFLDSLYISTFDDNGKPLPAISVQGSLAAGAEVSAVIISVGIEGGITLTIALLWNDPDNDGKLRPSEIVALIQQSPLCLFNFSGNLRFFLKLFIDIGFSPFDYSFDFTIIDLTLLDFSSNHTCDKPPAPPELAAIKGNTLYVFAGRLGTTSYRGTGWGNETSHPDEKLTVKQLWDSSDNPAGLEVDLINHTQLFSQAAAAGVTQVLVDARGYSGRETMLFTAARQQTGSNASDTTVPKNGYTLKTVVLSGDNDDSIKVPDQAGQRNAVVDGGGGNDQITVGDNNDVVSGGLGDDNIKTGNGDNSVFGDHGLAVNNIGSDITGAVDADGHTHTLHSSDGIADVNSVGTPGSPGDETGGGGNDHINVGLGANHVYGGAGNDQVSVAADSPLAAYPVGDPHRDKCAVTCTSKGDYLVGGTGNNTIVGGSGDDTIFAGKLLSVPSDKSTWTGDSGDGTNRVDTGNGNDTVYGGGGRDFITGHSKPVTGKDCAGAVSTHQSDCVYAGDGNDVVQLGDGDNVAYGGAGDDVIRGGGGVNELHGQAGDDVLVGVSGDSALFGDAGDDYLFGGDAKFLDGSGNTISMAAWDVTTGFTTSAFGKKRSTLAALPAAPGTGNSRSNDLLVGGADNDHIFAGDGGDEVYGDTQANKCQITDANALYTPPSESGQNAVATPGADGNDFIVGGKGVDNIQAGGGADFVTGGGGNSFLCGGAGADEVHGSTGASVHIWGGSGDDNLYADSGNDWIFGNGGDDNIFGGTGFVYAEGGDGSDKMYGGQGPSVLIGGTSAAGASDTSSGGPYYNQIFGGPNNDIEIGNNGCANSSLVTDSCKSGDPIQVFDLNPAGGAGVGGPDLIDGGAGDNRIFGGLGDDVIHAGPGNNYVEGNDGADAIDAGDGTNVVIGGTRFATTPDAGDTITVGNGHNVVIGDNGCANNALMSFSCAPGTRSVQYVWAAAASDATPMAVFDLPTGDASLGGNDKITGGNGGDMVFGGLGDDSVVTGSGDDYIEGGPGNDRLVGGGGNNDLLGGTSPLALPAGQSPSGIADGSNTIFANNLWGAGAGDGNDVVIANNGSITRDAPAQLDTTREAGTSFLKRHVTVLDIYSGHPQQGAGSWVYGGTKDDILLGGPGGDHVFGGPPLTAPAVTHDATGLAGANLGLTLLDSTAEDATFHVPACESSPATCNFNSAGAYGNDYIEGGPGADRLHGGGGDDDIIAGVSTLYLDRSVEGFDSAGATSAVADTGNWVWGGAGNDYLVGGNGQIAHTASGGHWAVNGNDGSLVRTVQLFDLDGAAAGIGGGDTVWGMAGDDHIYGGNGDDRLHGGPGADYVEGGPGADLITGGGGDDDLIGGTSADSVAGGAAAAATTPDGNPIAVPAGARTGNTICGYVCGQTMTPGVAPAGTIADATDDDSIVGDNARISRCSSAAADSWAGCAWSVLNYGNQMTRDGWQTGTITAISLGSPRQRFVTLLAQSYTNVTSDGNDYIEGNGGNNWMWGEDGADVIHAATPAAGSPRPDECLATGANPLFGQNVAVGGYGADVLCGGSGDDALIAERGLVTIVPFAGAPQVMGQLNGPPFTTVSCPQSGCTIYRVNLQTDNAAQSDPVQQMKPSTAPNAGDILFGSLGNDTLHGGAGDDFLEGDDGLHVAGSGVTLGGDDILFGGDGNDSLEGGAGNDIEFGGYGNDDMDELRGTTASTKLDNNLNALPPLYPTIADYTTRFPLLAGQVYDYDSTGNDVGGTVTLTKQIGDWQYGGYDRNVLQSNPNGFGDRLMDMTGNFNIDVLCPAYYGQFQVLRVPNPTMRAFFVSMANAGLANSGPGNDASIDANNATSSGGRELSLIINGTNQGQAYTGTPGHFTCPTTPTP